MDDASACDLLAVIFFPTTKLIASLRQDVLTRGGWLHAMLSNAKNRALAIDYKLFLHFAEIQMKIGKA